MRKNKFLEAMLSTAKLELKTHDIHNQANGHEETYESIYFLNLIKEIKEQLTNGNQKSDIKLYMKNKNHHLMKDILKESF